MIRIDVFSDVVCPWCFIGKRRLERAAASSGAELDVVWHAFELQPQLPPDGVPLMPFFAQKFGGEERVREAFGRVTEVGRGDGIAFDFTKMKRAVNTRLAHRIVWLASGQGKAGPVVEALFRGAFERGADLGSRAALFELLEAEGVGLDLARLAERLDQGEGLEDVVADEEAAAHMGVRAVPFFVANGRLAVSGAQPVEAFESLFAKAAELPLPEEPLLRRARSA